jgi:Uma2 family endonuclease
MSAITPLPELHRVKLRATDYLMLSDAGAFNHLGRTELIEGDIWTMNAVHSWHAKTSADVTVELALSMRDTDLGVRVFTAGSVLLSADSVPEPDVFVAADNDTGVLPLEKLRIAIEIADATAAQDLGVKRRLYARAAVPEYWVIDRETRTVHQFWAPLDGQFTGMRTTPFGARVVSATLASVAIETAMLG